MCDKKLGQPAPTHPTFTNPADEIQIDFGPPMAPPELGPIVTPPEDPDQVWSMARRVSSSADPTSTQPASQDGGRLALDPPKRRHSGRVSRFCSDKTGQFVED